MKNEISSFRPYYLVNLKHSDHSKIKFWIIAREDRRAWPVDPLNSLNSDAIFKPKKKHCETQMTKDRKVHQAFHKQKRKTKDKPHIVGYECETSRTFENWSNKEGRKNFSFLRAGTILFLYVLPHAQFSIPHVWQTTGTKKSSPKAIFFFSHVRAVRQPEDGLYYPQTQGGNIHTYQGIFSQRV